MTKVRYSNLDPKVIFFGEYWYITNTLTDKETVANHYNCNDLYKNGVSSIKIFSKMAKIGKKRFSAFLSVWKLTFDISHLTYDMIVSYDAWMCEI